jgi:hypothetical protein
LKGEDYLFGVLLKAGRPPNEPQKKFQS